MRMPLLLVTLGSLVSGLFVGWIVRVYLTIPLRLLGDWLVLRHAENPGIAFGVRMPSPWQEILILAALALVASIAIRCRTVLGKVAYGIILGGALANVWDRLVDGTVTDYFAVGSFPVFNVADSCITIGVVLLLAESIGVGRIMRRKS